MPAVGLLAGVIAAGVVGTVVTGVLFGVTWAVIAVTAGTIVTRIAPADLRGEALGVYAALSTLAGGIGSIGGGALAATSGFAVAFGGAGVVILAGAGLVAALRDSLLAHADGARERRGVAGAGSGVKLEPRYRGSEVGTAEPDRRSNPPSE